MGGDRAPEEIVAGALLAAREWDAQIILTGDEARVRPLLTGAGADLVTLVHAPETVPMDQHAAQALRSADRTSLGIAVNLVKTGAGRRRRLGRQHRRFPRDRLDQTADDRGHRPARHRDDLAGIGRVDRAARLGRQRRLPSRMARTVRHDGRRLRESRPESRESARRRPFERRRTHQRQPAVARSRETARCDRVELHRERRRQRSVSQRRRRRRLRRIRGKRRAEGRRRHHHGSLDRHQRDASRRQPRHEDRHGVTGAGAAPAAQTLRL